MAVLGEHGLVTLWERIKRYVKSYVDENIPIASVSRIGGIRPDNDTVTVDSNGTLRARQTPVATTRVAGKVMPDGTTITVDRDGTIHYELPRATESKLGGIVVGNSLYTQDGKLVQGVKTSAEYGSHAEGYNTKAAGQYAHAEGYNTDASGGYAHAEGHETSATEYCSHAEGNGSKAYGANSHAEGGRTIARGDDSHAGGYASESRGTDSFAHGFGVIAYADEQAVFGKYNKLSTNEEYVFILGNGPDSNHRSNAFAVRWNGDVECAGNLPAATLSKIGGVKPDGTTITVDEDGTLHGSNGYELPIATPYAIGGVKPDGTTITVDDDGTLHGNDGYELPAATLSKIGGVKPDGSTITIDPDGTLHGASTYELPVATSYSIGGVKIDSASGINIDNEGCLYFMHDVASSSTVDEYTKNDDGGTPMYPGGSTPKYLIDYATIRRLWKNMTEYVGQAVGQATPDDNMSNYVRNIVLYRLIDEVMDTVYVINMQWFAGGQTHTITLADDEYIRVSTTFMLKYDYENRGYNNHYLSTPILNENGERQLTFLLPNGESVVIIGTEGDNSDTITMHISESGRHQISLERFVPSSAMGQNIGYATEGTAGIIKVGYGLSIDNGVLSVDMEEIWAHEQEEGNVWVEANVMDAINSAIKTKTGRTSDYEPSEMPSAILGISSSPRLLAKTITANGTYMASSEGYDGYSSVTINVSTGSSSGGNTGSGDSGNTGSGGSGDSVNTGSDDSGITVIEDPKPDITALTLSVPNVNLPSSSSADIGTEATLVNYFDIDDSDRFDIRWGTSDNSYMNYALYASRFDRFEQAVRVYPGANNVANGLSLMRPYDGADAYDLTTTGFTIYAVIRPICMDQDDVIACTASYWQEYRNGLVLAGDPIRVYSGSDYTETDVSSSSSYIVMVIRGMGTDGKVFLADNAHENVVTVQKTVNSFGLAFTLCARGQGTLASSSEPNGICDVYVRYLSVVERYETDSVIQQNIAALKATYLVDEGQPILLPYSLYGYIRNSSPYYAYDDSTDTWYNTKESALSHTIVNIPSAVSVQNNSVHVVGTGTAPIVWQTYAASESASSASNIGQSCVVYVVMRFVQGSDDNYGIKVLHEQSTLAKIYSENDKWCTYGNVTNGSSTGSGVIQLSSNSSTSSFNAFAIAFEQTSSGPLVAHYYCNGSKITTQPTYTYWIDNIQFAPDCECEFRYFAVVMLEDDESTIKKNLTKLRALFG